MPFVDTVIPPLSYCEITENDCTSDLENFARYHFALFFNELLTIYSWDFLCDSECVTVYMHAHYPWPNYSFIYLFKINNRRTWWLLILSELRRTQKCTDIRINVQTEKKQTENGTKHSDNTKHVQSKQKYENQSSVLNGNVTDVVWRWHGQKSKSKPDIAVRNRNYHTATGNHMLYEITQCYLPPGRGDFPAFTPAEAGTRFSDPGGMQGWVDLGGGYIPR